MSTGTPTTKRYATLATAADYAGGCDERTLRRYIASGKLTAYRMGPRLVRVDLNEVDNLMRPIPTAKVR